MDYKQLIEKVGHDTFFEIENMGYKRGVGVTMVKFSITYFLKELFLRIFSKPYSYERNYFGYFLEKIIPYVFLGFSLATLLFLIFD